MKKVMFFVLLVFFLAPSVFADTIRLKSGQEFEAKILERTDKSIKVDFNGAQLTYFLDEVEKINNEPVLTVISASVEAPSASTAAPAIASAPEAEPLALVGSVEPIATSQTSAANQAVESASTVEPPRINVDQRPVIAPSQKLPVYPNPKKLPPVDPVMMGIVALVILFSLLLFYVYTAICVQIIAVKTAKGPAWLAWIPIANLFLMCKVAGLSYWYLLIILGVFIPMIGFLISLGFSAFIWYMIALARNKPGWIGALACIPLVNLVIMGYLAFSE